MTDMELLLWLRGPGLQISIAVFLLGMVVRLTEMFMLRRKPDLSEARGSASAGGWRTVFTRSVPIPGVMKTSGFVVIAGYIFHIGFLVTLFLFVPHIHLFRELLGFGWPGLPVAIIDLLTVLSIAALVGLLVHRLMNPVRRMLSDFQDYLVWLLTTLPLATGYLMMHSSLVPYTNMFVLHIISVELLLVAFPFTRLVHAVTFIAARWYNGAISGRKGVRV